MIEDHTFGNSKAAVNLMRTLKTSDHAPYARTVMSLLSKYYSSTGAISDIPNDTVRGAVLIIWHHRFEDIMRDKDVPEVLKTHTLCVATTRSRQLRRRKI